MEYKLTINSIVAILMLISSIDLWLLVYACLKGHIRRSCPTVIALIVLVAFVLFIAGFMIGLDIRIL